MRSFSITLNRYTALFAIIFAFFSPLVHAKDEKYLYSVTFENDLFGGDDQYYTNGIEFDRFSPSAGSRKSIPFIFRKLNLDNYFSFKNEGGNWSLSTGDAIGNLMYTPENLSENEIIKNDRPYGGWLYYRQYFGVENESTRHKYDLQLGWTGKASQAEYLQKRVHAIFGGVPPKGWDNQIRFEPAANFNYLREQEIIQLRKSNNDIKWFNSSYFYGGSLGNVFTHLKAGYNFRLGWNIKDFGDAGFITPAIMGEHESKAETSEKWYEKIEVYAIAEMEGRLVAHNIFLDGSLFRETPHTVDKERLLNEQRYGIVFGYGSFKLKYIEAKRSREFKQQTGGQHWGLLSLSFSCER